MSRQKSLILGTTILTAAGFLSRIIGFFYRIFLSRTIGAKEIGRFQLLAPIGALCVSFCIGGISTMLSRTISAKMETGKKKEAFDLLYLGSGFCILLSCLASGILLLVAPALSRYLFESNSYAPMIRILAYSIPLSAIHTCGMTYYFARQKTVIPSLLQLTEQIVRVLSTCLTYTFFLSQGQKPDAQLAVTGLLSGECAACLCTFLVILWETKQERYHFQLSALPFSELRKILTLSAPLTLDRLCITLLHGAEAILIPGQLQKAGLHPDEALSVYGILTGMALPVILFPGTITNSVAVLLLPGVAKDQASGNQANVRRTIELTIRYCLLLGILSAGIFCVYGKTIGTILFQKEEAGTFLQILAFLSPFLYLNSTLSSILNGLGQTRFSFYQNAAGLLMRILFVIVLTPILGIRGYLFGLLSGELVSALLNILYLKHTASFSFCASENIIKPLCSLLMALGIGFAVTAFLDYCSITAQFLRLVCTLGCTAFSYLAPFAAQFRRPYTSFGT